VCVARSLLSWIRIRIANTVWGSSCNETDKPAHLFQMLLPT
jgi:hypothetical protein